MIPKLFNQPPASTDDAETILSELPSDQAQKIAESIRGYFGLDNIRVTYPIGSEGRANIEVWSTGMTRQQIGRLTSFAIGVSWGIVAQRGF